MLNLTVPIVKGDRKSSLDYIDTLPVNYIATIRDITGDQGYLLAHDGLTEFANVSGVARGGFLMRTLRSTIEYQALL